MRPWMTRLIGRVTDNLDIVVSSVYGCSVSAVQHGKLSMPLEEFPRIIPCNCVMPIESLMTVPLAVE